MLAVVNRSSTIWSIRPSRVVIVASFGLALGCTTTTVVTPAPAPADASPADGEESDEVTEPAVRACYLDERAATTAKAPKFSPPSGKYLGKCSKKTIEDLLVCTHKSDAEAPDDPHCQALVPEKACIACIFGEGGAIVDVKFPNVPGCIALATGDASTDGCGAAYNEWHACQKAGCASCFSNAAVPRDDRQACAQEAAASVCADRSPIDACGDLEQNAEYKEICEQPDALNDTYLGRLYNYFCGSPGAF